MYQIDILGESVTAHVLARLCRRSGFDDLRIVSLKDGFTPNLPGLTLGSNQSRILYALGLSAELDTISLKPDREQVRLARSRYLISELPLGKFYQDRYGAPLINVEHVELEALFHYADPTDSESSDATSPAALTIATEGSATPDPSWELLHSAQPRSHAAPQSGTKATANITWLATNAIAWQFATSSRDHFYILKSKSHSLNPQDWHPSLWDQLQQAMPIELPRFDVPVREYWTEGNRAYLGQACLPYHPIRRETWFSGLEDAWVLSRMIENYEEAIGEGLAAYQEFRRPRAQRILRSNTELMRTSYQNSPVGRLARNIGIGLRSRFLPEIAMQRIDWLYGYDCIKGFH